MTTALVTGGAGFIGSHLVDYLLAKGCRVICIDNLITGSSSNIAHNAGNPNFRFIKYNIIDYIIIDEPVDRIYHLASPASPVHYYTHSIHTFKVNTIGTINVLGLAREKKARVLLASTSEIYGDPLIHPQREDYFGNVNTIGPRAIYDEGKRAAEAIVMEYRRKHGLDIRIARIFNTYGPRMAWDDGRVVSNFITQALSDRDITIFGDGSQTRSFCYVSDLVEGLYKLMESNFCEPVNLGNPYELTMNELAQRVIGAVGSRSRVVCRPLPQDDPKVRRPDISRAKTVLGWEPRVSFGDGLARTIEYFRTGAKA